MDYRILGPLEVIDEDRRLSLGGARQRAVLALLLLHGNEALTRDVIVDALWGQKPPQTAAKVLQNCVSALRKGLPGGAETLRTVGGGYALRLEADELDRDRFERLFAEGRAALAVGDHAEAAERLREALALWRGSPLSDFSYERFAQDEITRLEELHVAAVEDRIEADLALCRSGRQAEALDAYRAARRRLLAELGIEPGRPLHELERAILAQDPALDALQPRQTAPSASAEVRPGRRAAAPVVGRDDELALLEAGLEDALAGRGRLFVVVGGPGTGKTHLGDEIASRAKARGASILWGRGWHGGGAPPFWPWSRAMRSPGRTLPDPAADDEAARFHFFEAVTEALRAEAAEQPVLLVFDDLQAADEDSLLLIEFLASELPEMAMLVVALGREDTPRINELARHATHTLHLEPREPSAREADS